MGGNEGYGTREEMGSNALFTRINLPDDQRDEVGALTGRYNGVEVSFSQQRFDTEGVVAARGIGEGFRFQQDIIGVKLRGFGDRPKAMATTVVMDLQRGRPQRSRPFAGGMRRIRSLSKRRSCTRIWPGA